MEYTRNLRKSTSGEDVLLSKLQNVSGASRADRRRDQREGNAGGVHGCGYCETTTS